MTRLLILTLALFALTFLAYLVHRRPHTDTSPLADDLTSAITELALRTPRKAYSRLRMPGNLFHLMRDVLYASAGGSAWTFLQEQQRDFALALLQLRQDIKHASLLPADGNGVPRMLLLAREMVRHDAPCTAESLLHALTAWHRAASTTYAERMTLPLCLRIAAAERLRVCLLEMQFDQHQAQSGLRIAKRLSRRKHPVRILSGIVMTPALTDALTRNLRQNHQTDLLSAVDEHLHATGLSAAELSAAQARNQARCSETLMQCLQQLNSVSQLNWTDTEESEDPLHQLLLQDPSGVYPRMTLTSRSSYRQHIAQLSQRFRLDELRLMRGVLHLSSVPEKDGLLDHVGWYLLEPEGIRALHRYLKAPRGRLSILFAQYRDTLCRAALFFLNALSALLLLQRGYTLWLLSPLLMVTACGWRFLLTRLFPPPKSFVPQIAFDHVPDHLRTLVVMPAVLRSRTDAVPAVRRLLLASHAMPEGAVDYLLLGDYADALTATSGEDSTVIYAVQRAMEALNAHQDRQSFLYLQRSRSYDHRLHRYTGRDGLQGALADVRQLIAEGSCPDLWDEATLSPSGFHRRYAYMLVITPETSLESDMLLPLLGTLEHPLNRRRAAIARPRVFPDPASLRTHMGQMHACTAFPEPCWLMDPHTLNSQVDAVAEPSQLNALLLEELSGCIAVPNSRIYPALPSAMSAWIAYNHQRTAGLWHQLSWLLPWKKAEQGVEPSPLFRTGRRHFRRALHETLLPAAQLIALFYAAYRGDGLFFLLVLTLPELSVQPWRHIPLRLLTRWGMLPLRAFSRLDAIGRSLWFRMTKREWHHSFHDIYPSLENWSQTLCALLFVLISVIGSPFFLLGILFGVLLGCFLLIHTHLDRPVQHHEPLTTESEASLMEIAHATWRYFAEHVNESTHHLPPEGVQIKPWRGASATVRPDDAGFYLLACLSAQELGLIDTNELAQRISLTLNTLESLPLWHGLPFAQYTLPALTPTLFQVDTQRCGLLCVCLLCTAQGLRAVLADLPEAYRTLPARLDAMARAMELHRLYDPSVGLFHLSINTQTDTPDPHFHRLYASPALLTSFAAVMLHQVPIQHLAQLDRSRVRLGRQTAACSPDGSAVDYLLPLLFLPVFPGTDAFETVRTILHAQRSHAYHGMYGISHCAVWQFDSQMNYLCKSCGLPELALHPFHDAQAVAPYAAALCLPFDRNHALDSLTRLRTHGMMGRFGFFDALDYDPSHMPEGAESQMVQCHFSGHQAMLLCALCNSLADDYLQRIFMAIPTAAAYSLSLREPRRSRQILPAALLHPSAAASPHEPPFRRQGQLDVLPQDAHLIGTADASLVMNTTGCGVMRARGVTLTCFTGAPGCIEGLQFYLGDGLRFFRLGDPMLQGETIFAEGCIRLIQRISDLQCTLCVMTDPASSTFLHTLEIVNLSGHERFLEVADCLIPAIQQQPCTLRAQRPLDRVLTLHCPQPERTVCHVLTTADPLISLHAHTELHAFSSDGSLSAPSSLNQSAADAFSPSPLEPCAGFRVKFSLGGRGRISMVLTTRFMRPGEAFSLDSLTPRATDLPHLLTLSRLACRAIYDTLDISQAQAALISRVTPWMLWHGQPHQGPVAPLCCTSAPLANFGLNPALPAIVLLMYTPAGLSLMQEAVQLTGWLHLSGQPAQLCVLLMGSEATSARQAAESILCVSPVQEYTILLTTADLPDGIREAIEAHARLLLYEGAGSLLAQLDALTTTQIRPLPALDSAPLPIPEEPLHFTTDHGGWQDQTDDYVLRLEPGMLPPCWYHPSELPLLHEHAFWLQTDNGCFTLMDSGLSRRIQFSPWGTQWQTRGNSLDVTLTAIPYPNSRLHLRSIRLKNMTDRSLVVTLHIAADFGSDAYLAPLHWGMTALRPDIQGMLCLSLTDGTPIVRRLCAASWAGIAPVPAGLSASNEETGSVAVLSLPLHLPSSGSASASWLVGACASLDELEPCLQNIHQQGVSGLLRQFRQHWAQRLSALTVSTPDASLNLLLNRLLPVQSHTLAAANCLYAVPFLTLTDPAAARRLLLNYHARDTFEDGLLMVIHISAYIRITGDSSILQDGEPTIYSRCMQALTAIRLGLHGLPLTREDPLGAVESVPLAFLFIMALQQFAELLSDEEQQEVLDVCQHVREAVEQSGWDGSWYRRGFTASSLPVGSSETVCCRIDLLTQALSVIALGASPRTIQAMDAAWQMLGNSASASLRTFTPPFDMLQDSSVPTPLLPGFALNGGQDTLCTVCVMAALCLTGQYDRAWLLIQALNPVLHADHTLPPWQLPGTLTANSISLTADVQGAAPLLLSIVLRHLLGLTLYHEQLSFAPHVPKAWDFFSLTLQRGSSTWHLHFSRSDTVLTVDGDPPSGNCIHLTDDGHIHQVRIPLDP